MSLSKRGAPTRNLVAFCEWAKANGMEIGEMPPYSVVHPVHVAGSWHYVTDGRYGQAADINVPGGGTHERAVLSHAVVVAESMGLGVTFALHGTVGSAASHKTHLHADVGMWSNLGGGAVERRAGDIVTARLQAAVHLDAKERDNLWGAITDARIEAVRAAAILHGGRFPHGVAFTQVAVGTPDDGDWATHSRHAHDLTVAAIQRALGIDDDGVWGKVTESRYQAARKQYHH